MASLRGTRLSKKASVFVASMPLFFITAFRGSLVGADTLNYIRTFERVAQCDSISAAFHSSRMENGYLLLNYLVSHIGLSYIHFQIIVSLFIYISLAIFIYKYSDNIWISFYVFVTIRMLLGTMNVVRSWCAIAIILFALSALVERKVLKYYILVLIAAQFHTVAYVMVILYPFCRFKRREIAYFAYISACLVIGAFYKPFFAFITHAIGRYEGYLTSIYFSSGYNMAVFLTFFLDVLFLFMLHIGHDNENQSMLGHGSTGVDSGIVIPNDVMVTTIVMTVGIDIIGLTNTILDRIAVFPRVMALITIPYAINHMKVNSNKTIIKMIIILILFLQYWFVLRFRPNWNCVIPYGFYWE